MKVLKRALLFPFYLALGFFVFAFLFFYETPKMIFSIFSINQKEDKVD